MQQRRPAAANGLGLVMPRPVLPHRRSASLRSGLASPRTPMNCASPPSSFFFNASTSSRRSRDSGSSWNSSNGDEADAVEAEWTSDHIKLLQRTMDALPSNILTPFTGPVPPSNLLDKMAKGLVETADWPHSLRATRARIVELARSRAKGGDDIEVFKATTNTPPRRSLRQQTSLDSIEGNRPDLQSDTIIRLSTRLQKVERVLSFQPTSRPSTPSSRSSVSENVPSILPSSSCFISRPELLRYPFSAAQPLDMSENPPSNNRVSRLRRYDSFVSAATSSRPFKRAPSFSSSSDSSRMSIVVAGKDNAPSSDEEEKSRSRKAKKPRTKAESPVRISMALSNSSSRSSDTKKDDSDYSANSLSSSSTKVSASGAKSTSNSTKNPSSPTSRRLPMNIQRNPSILGGLLPGVKEQESSFATKTSGSLPGSTAPRPTSLHPPRTLRRVKRTELRSPVRKIGRKISFGSLGADHGGDDDDHNYPSTGSMESSGSGSGLGDAFQLK